MATEIGQLVNGVDGLAWLDARVSTIGIYGYLTCADLGIHSFYSLHCIRPCLLYCADGNYRSG